VGQKVGIFVISDKNWDHLLGTVKAAESKGIEVIIMGKPPALPGDSQSLTFPGVCFSPSAQPRRWVTL